MRLIKPFRGVRPKKELASKVASHPYDVINRVEAKQIAGNNPYSFLHINKPEIDVSDDIDAYDPIVYETGRVNLDEFITSGILAQDEEETFYIYKQKMGSHEQVGFVATASIESYDKGLIKKHEFTRPDKENDRVQHMDALGAQVGPVFLTYKSSEIISKLIGEVVLDDPEYDFNADDGTRHTFWVVSSNSVRNELHEAFNKLDCLYVADGHHRSAAASRVRKLHADRNNAHTGNESYNFFLAVLFPHDQVQILDYNRIIKDLNGLGSDEFLVKLQKYFEIEKAKSGVQIKPDEPGRFGLYLDYSWYKLIIKPDFIPSKSKRNPAEDLDVSLMQRCILSPILDIHDQRVDKRIDFVGGIRGLSELETRVDNGGWSAAIAIHPTSIESLMKVADANQVMPPKSTWFEPKLKSGLITHLLD